MEIETDSRCRLSRWRGRTLRAVVFLLLLGGISHMIGCNGLFYYPSARQYSKPADLRVPVEEVEFKSADGTALYGWLLRPPGEKEALGTVVHFHGNAQNMTSHVHFVDWLAERGYNVFVFDYRGYGRSGGRAKRSGIIADSRAALDYMRGRKDIDSSRLLVLGQSLGGASLSIVLRDNRRYGGYIVHIGIAVLVIGIVISSMYKITEEKIAVGVGEYARIGNYLINPYEVNRPFSEIAEAYSKIQAKTHRVEDFENGLPYLRDQVSFRIFYDPLSRTKQAHAAEDSHGGVHGEEAARTLKTLPVTAREISRLRPERRFYPKQDQWINEVSIHRSLWQDVYVYYSNRDPDNKVYMTAYLNPFMGLLYIGTVIMLLGGIFAVLPFSGNRV